MVWGFLGQLTHEFYKGGRPDAEPRAITTEDFRKQGPSTAQVEAVALEVAASIDCGILFVGVLTTTKAILYPGSVLGPLIFGNSQVAAIVLCASISCP